MCFYSCIKRYFYGFIVEVIEFGSIDMSELNDNNEIYCNVKDFSLEGYWLYCGFVHASQPIGVIVTSFMLRNLPTIL